MKPNKSDKQYTILKKYLEGSVSREEEVMVYKWMSDPEQEILINSILTQLWDEMVDVKTWRDSRKSLEEIHQKINPVKSSIGSGIYTFIKVAGRIAAILLIPLLTYISWKTYTNGQSFSSTIGIDPVYNEIVCPTSARCQFELSDGTKVWLNTGSKFRYPVKFEGKARMVELEGEAYFDVKSDSTFPFIIQTQGIDVRVKGTRLNVNAYPEEKFQEVIVESGMVELIEDITENEKSIVKLRSGQYALHKDKDCLIDFNLYKNKEGEKTRLIDDETQLMSHVDKLQYGECAIFVKKGSSFLIKFDKANKYSAWKEGKFVLRNDPMASMLKRLERWYNVEFEVKDPKVYKYTYWATFENENIDEVLNLLNMSGPIIFQEKDRKIKEDGTFRKKVIQVSLNNKTI